MARLKQLSLLAIVALFVAYLCTFTVKQWQVAMVERLGTLVENSDDKVEIYGPGLHFMIPFISKVLTFDKRLQNYDIEKSRVVTVEKKEVIVDSYIKWRIGDFPRYYKATKGDQLVVEGLLRQKIGDGLRAQFGERTRQELVSGERLGTMAKIKADVGATARQLYGLVISDVRIKRIDLPPEVSESVFQNMRTERKQAASQHRAEGRRTAEGTRAAADAKRVVIVARATQQSKQLRSEGDAAAAKIYADAYRKNPEFFAFYRSMMAYEKAITVGDTLVLNPDGEFFKYFNSLKEQ